MLLGYRMADTTPQAIQVRLAYQLARQGKWEKYEKAIAYFSDAQYDYLERLLRVDSR